MFYIYHSYYVAFLVFNDAYTASRNVFRILQANVRYLHDYICFIQESCNLLINLYKNLVS